MKSLIFPGSCAIALCLVLSSFVSGGDNYSNTIPSYNGPSAAVFQDTVPRKGSARKNNSNGNMSGQGAGTWGQGNQSSDTRGEGINKGRKGMKQKGMDSTNHGAMNTTDTTGA